MSDPFLLDTTAIFALMEDEPGADRVQQLLRHFRVLLPFCVLLETYYISMQERGEAEANRRYAQLKQSRAEILWTVDEPTLFSAGFMKARHHLSLADSLIAGFAVQHKAILVHKDPEFEAVADQVHLEPLSYRSVRRR